MSPGRGDGGGGLVYSSDVGRTCPRCERAIDACTCDDGDAVPVTDGVVRIRRETKGRRGKGMTVITGVPLVPAELARLAKELKRRCGSGGTARDGVIEIQGDHVATLLPLLQARGWTVKRSGG